jgi:hypothetical protein
VYAPPRFLPHRSALVFAEPLSMTSLSTLPLLLFAQPHVRGTAVRNISVDLISLLGPSLGAHVCGTAVCGISVNDTRPFISVLLFSLPLYLERFPPLQLLAKLQCLDTTPRNHLYPLLVIPLEPCRLIFGLMVRAILSSSQITYIELMWIFRPWSTEAASPSGTTCNTEGH